jgi:hypothetical protein
MAQAKAVREIPTITEWGKAVDSVSTNYAKGTKVEVAKANKTLIPKKGAQPLFHYVNRYGVTGDWYAKIDLLVVDKPKNGKVKVTATSKAKFSPEQLAKIQALMAQGIL